MKATRRNRKLVAAILCTALVFAFSVGSLAAMVYDNTAGATPTVTLSDTTGAVVFSSNRPDTNLFDNFLGVMPGDVLTQEIIVETPSTLGNRNNSDYNIYLSARLGHTAEPGDDDHGHTDTHNQGFYDLMEIEVKNSTETLDIINITPGTDGVHLGRFSKSGTTVTLTVTLKVPSSMGNDFQNAIAYIDWIFYAQGIDEPIRPTDPIGPSDPDDGDDEEEEGTEPTTQPEEEITTGTPLGPTEPPSEPSTTEPEFPGEEDIIIEDVLIDMPDTGYQSKLPFWATLAVISGGAMAYLLLGLKPQKKN